MKIKHIHIIVSSLLALILAVVLIGCAAQSSPVPTAPVSAPVAQTPAQVEANLLQFAETTQNIVQTLNTGAAILAPAVNNAAALSTLVIHGSQEQQVVNKITSINSVITANAVAQGLPASTVVALANTVNTPAVASAVVTQVVAPPLAPATPVSNP